MSFRLLTRKKYIEKKKGKKLIEYLKEHVMDIYYNDGIYC